MPRYEQTQVPRGPNRKWEIVMDEGAEGHAPLRTAADVQREHRVLRNLDPDELRSLPLLATGALLERRQWYLDLHNPARGEFPGSGREHVRPGQRVVARSRSSDSLWRALLEACEEVLGHRRGTAA